jgi:uncharacterized protein (DUF1778 family)
MPIKSKSSDVEKKRNRPLTIRLTYDQHEQLERAAARERRSLAFVVSEIIGEALERNAA